MATNRKKQTSHSPDRSSRRRLSAQGFYTPFESLDQHLEEISPAKPHAAPSLPVVSQPKQSGPVKAEDEEKVFQKAMADVMPLPNSGASRVPPAPPTKHQPRFLAQEELEVYTYLVDLVEGEAQFELSYSDEYVDGCIIGLSPMIMKKLRKGDFSYQDYVDLHGLNRSEARERAIHFIRQSFGMGLRCVLVVSGRGLNSEDKQPVLKKGLVTWLTQAPLKRIVLAFTSARAHDGGAGAFYVLLRKNEGKAKFQKNKC